MINLEIGETIYESQLFKQLDDEMSQLFTEYLVKGVQISYDTLNSDDIYRELKKDEMSDDFISGYKFALSLLDCCKERIANHQFITEADNE